MNLSSEETASSPEDAAGGGEPPAKTSDDERAARLANLMELIDLIRPAVQSDGGDLVLLSADMDSGVIEVQLQGSCSSCAISSTTLQAGVERILKERLDWVSEVIGSIDEDIDWEESASMGRGGYTPAW
jgi:Fe-S cluster biogenesis protein NfuA